jgi:hypothetical protein
VNGNNLPIRQFESNEAYGAMGGGLTYWWVSSQDPTLFSGAQYSIIKNLKLWNIYNKNIYHYPGQKVIIDGLVIRGNYVAASKCCAGGVWFADYSATEIVIRNADIQGMLNGVKGPSSGFGPNPNLLIENSYLRNWNNVNVPTPSSTNGCWMENKLITVNNTRLETPPGKTLNAIAMTGPAEGTECLSKLDELRVYSYNGNASDNFQVYHTSTSVLPRPPASCTPTTRTGISGLLCPIAPAAGTPTTPSAPTNVRVVR